MTTSKTLKDLFLDSLKDLYYAEHKILETLPSMVNAAQDARLKAAFEKHLTETDCHVDRLEQIFEQLGEMTRAKTCDAIDGILKEGSSIIDAYRDTPAGDAGLIAAAQAVEHYEITRYEVLKRWAETLGYGKTLPILEQSLQEEKATDQHLVHLTEQAIVTAKQDLAA